MSLNLIAIRDNLLSVEELGEIADECFALMDNPDIDRSLYDAVVKAVIATHNTRAIRVFICTYFDFGDGADVLELLEWATTEAGCRWPVIRCLLSCTFEHENFDMRFKLDVDELVEMIKEKTPDDLDEMVNWFAPYKGCILETRYADSEADDECVFGIWKTDFDEHIRDEDLLVVIRSVNGERKVHPLFQFE